MHCGYKQQCSTGQCLLLISLMLSLLLVTASASLAGVVTHFVPPYFGEIDLHPGGDTIVIAAQNGPALPSAGRSVVTGGGSGRLILTSSDAEQVQVLYPESITLTHGGQSITMRGIPALSQQTATLPGGNVQREIHIGGSLALQGNENRGTYNGSMTIQINFF